MHDWLTTADGILRRATWTTRPASGRGLAQIVSCLLLFSLFYGATMGTFRVLAGQPQWLLQIIYSSVKVPLLLLATFAISLPSFYVLKGGFFL